MVIIVVQRLVVTRHRRWPLRWGHMNCCQEIFQRGIYVCAGVFDILKMDKTPLIYSRSPPHPYWCPRHCGQSLSVSCISCLRTGRPTQELCDDGTLSIPQQTFVTVLFWTATTDVHGRRKDFFQGLPKRFFLGLAKSNEIPFHPPETMRTFFAEI